jgi:hypothetical protein
MWVEFPEGVVREGGMVVLDPTGRNMDECLEVGRVVVIQDGPDGGTVLTVALNSGSQVYNVDSIRAVL